MLFAGWEVHVVKKTVTKKMLPEATDQGQHFQDCGHSCLLYGLNLTQQISCLCFSSLSQISVLINSLPTTQACCALQIQ